MRLTSSDPIEGSKDIMSNIISRISLNKIAKKGLNNMDSSKEICVYSPKTVYQVYKNYKEYMSKTFNKNEYLYQGQCMFAREAKRFSS